MSVKVSELLVSYLERLGIESIFGMPGAHILPVYDALYDSEIQSVLVKHEQGAAFMAGGFARSSGKIGACITTAGPGATNLVTGIANAYADKLPVLIITGETSTHIFGRGGLQESSGEGGAIDQNELFKSITRYNKIVERTDYLPQVLNQASRILLSDNPGPVLLSFPFNVQKEMVDASILDKVVTQRHTRSIVDDCASVAALADKLLSADHPVIIAGHGAIRSGAKKLVSRLSSMLSAPVATSLKAKGVIDEKSELSLGSLGVSSSGHAFQYIVDRSDLLLILGAGFNERTSYVWDNELLKNKTIIQVDNDPGQLEKVYRADMAIQGNIAQVLGAVLEHIGEYSADTERYRDTRDYIASLKYSSKNDYAVFQSGFSLVERFYEKLEEHFPAGVAVYDDNIIFAQNFYRVSDSNGYYPNSGISSLGHAIPAAIGGRFAIDMPTFAILGDGGFQMCCMEIMTAVNYQKPLNVVVFNNATMGLIRKNQYQQYEKRFIDCDFINPGFQDLASSFGIQYKKVEAETDLDELFSHYDLNQGINLIELVLDRDLFPNYSSRR